MRFVGLQRRREDGGLGLGVVEIGDRRRALRDQFGVALEVALGAFKLRLVARDVALGLQDLRLDRAAVERDQEVALLHARAVGEMNFGDLAVDPALDRDAGDRRHGAERLDPHRRGSSSPRSRLRPAPDAARAGACATAPCGLQTSAGRIRSPRPRQPRPRTQNPSASSVHVFQARDCFRARSSLWLAAPPRRNAPTRQTFVPKPLFSSTFPVYVR